MQRDLKLKKCKSDILNLPVNKETVVKDTYLLTKVVIVSTGGPLYSILNLNKFQQLYFKINKNKDDEECCLIFIITFAPLWLPGSAALAGQTSDLEAKYEFL